MSDPFAIALDTSVIVAGLLSWHEHHEASVRALEEALGSAAGVVLPLTALIEAYAVMTRLPAPHRLAAKDALALLEDSFRGRVRLVGLSGDDGWRFARGLGERGIAGGRTYDALIAAAARQGGAARILTLNRQHFEKLDPALACFEP